MSLEAMVWALKSAPVNDPHEHLVLLGLADHADPNGRAAYPSATTLAEYARCSVRTVRYRLKQLEAAGLIQRGDQNLLAYMRADQRPVVYDLAVGVTTRNGVQEMHPVDGVQEMHGVHSQVARGAQPGIDGVHAAAHKPSLNRTEPYFSSSSPAATMDSDDAFTAFWGTYPRRTGKAAARKAFVKAAAKVNAWGVIVRSARRMAEDPNLPDAKFIPHPATWLNQERWDDPPYPPRAGARGSADQRVQAGLDLAARLAEQEAHPHLRAIGGGR